MANFSEQLQEIKTLLSSDARSQRPLAYSTLLHLQEQSSSSADPTLIQLLADSSRSLFLPIIADISNNDEEIAAQALKCLGFMIYHPALVAAFSGDDANLIVESLTKVIITTRIKSVCNLGVWCISIQQIDAIYLAENFSSLLRAIAHALDNPIGSLSTAFEAIQAVMKLGSQLKEKMRDTAEVWAPPIYRRLVSIDKRVRDMSERCLLKIGSIICPPPITLSKALVIDMKKKLLPGMKLLQNQGLKIQAIQAWGWFIRLLGSYAVKNRHLVNEMLKIPEQTFSDVDTQVQIASLVSWEGLIDALIELKDGPETYRIEGEGISKSVRLIMTPLMGIMSSKCDVSVHSSCLSTWCYLLHKLDTSVNHPSIKKHVWDPMMDAVFRIRLENKNILIWNICLDLLEDFISTNIRGVGDELNKKRTCQLSGKHFVIKWLPWNLNELDFFMKTILMLNSQGSMVTVSLELRTLACDAALRIFRSILKGVRIVLKNSSINYDEVMCSLNKILGLVKAIFEEANSEKSDINDSYSSLHHFIEAIIEELEPLNLGSPLYKVVLDLKYIDHLQSTNETKIAEVLRVRFLAYGDMVSPVVYLTLLYLCGVLKLNLNAASTELILQDACKFLKNVFSLFDPSEILHAATGLLYKHVKFENLKIWAVIVYGLKDYIDGVNNLLSLKPKSYSPHCLAVCHLFSYPFVLCSCSQEQSIVVQGTKLPESCINSLQSQRKLELEHVVEVLKSLYLCVHECSNLKISSSNSFPDDLLVTLNKCLDVKTKMLESSTELNQSKDFQNPDLLFLIGNTVICMIGGICSRGGEDRDDGERKRSSGVSNVLGFAARFITMSLMIVDMKPIADLAVVSRVFLALVHYAGCLYSKEDILSFVQIMLNPLRQWLSCKHSNHQFQLLWSSTLKCLQRSDPPITFDTTFLENQSNLFVKALDHPNPSISEPTITFWNSTFAMEAKLDYPRSLLSILDRLSRSGKITLCDRSFPSIRKCNSIVTSLPRYTVTSTQNMSSKRVELVEDKVMGIGPNDNQVLKLKRKRRELTEHQKEVRRAQQGRGRDCSGHGPGIRTYTSVDFSQGNEESQDSQEIEIRDAEAILEKLRRDG